MLAVPALDRVVVVLGHDADAIRAARRLRRRPRSSSARTGRAGQGFSLRARRGRARRRRRRGDHARRPAVHHAAGDRRRARPARRLRRRPRDLRRQARPPGRARPPRPRRRAASSRATPARASCSPASGSASGRRGTWPARPTSTRKRSSRGCEARPQLRRAGADRRRLAGAQRPRSGRAVPARRRDHRRRGRRLPRRVHAEGRPVRDGPPAARSGSTPPTRPRACSDLSVTGSSGHGATIVNTLSEVDGATRVDAVAELTSPARWPRSSAAA